MIGIIIAALIIVALYWFFGTEIGSALRATGNNEDMIRALGVNTKMTKMIALMLSNGSCRPFRRPCMSESEVCGYRYGYRCYRYRFGSHRYRRRADGKFRSFGSRLASAIVGSVVYFLIRAVVLQLGMDANDMKLLSAIIVALALVFLFL